MKTKCHNAAQCCKVTWPYLAGHPSTSLTWHHSKLAAVAVFLARSKERKVENPKSTEKSCLVPMVMHPSMSGNSWMLGKAVPQKAWPSAPRSPRAPRATAAVLLSVFELMGHTLLRYEFNVPIISNLQSESNTACCFILLWRAIPSPVFFYDNAMLPFCKIDWSWHHRARHLLGIDLLWYCSTHFLSVHDYSELKFTKDVMQHDATIKLKPERQWNSSTPGSWSCP